MAKGKHVPSGVISALFRLVGIVAGITVVGGTRILAYFRNAIKARGGAETEAAVKAEEPQPSTGCAETPEDGAHETPEDGAHETPEDGAHETPEDGAHEDAR